MYGNVSLARNSIKQSLIFGAVCKSLQLPLEDQFLPIFADLRIENQSNDCCFVARNVYPLQLISLDFYHYAHGPLNEAS